MEFSLPAWLGALAGTIIAVALYVPGIRIVERRLRAQGGPQTLQQRAAFDDKLSVVRRVILAVDIAVLATAGYWAGNVFDGR
ncbi:MAG TPA: hypothetical protein VEF90_01365 [Xanthobacteraceae bacterium]|nr:hypothetical protein [Xanthobacteraceae bacterium]